MAFRFQTWIIHDRWAWDSRLYIRRVESFHNLTTWADYVSADWPDGMQRELNTLSEAVQYVYVCISVCMLTRRVSLCPPKVFNLYAAECN